MASPPGPLGVTLPGWEALAAAWSLPAFRGRQVFDALHRRGVRDYAAMRELPRNLRERLARESPLRFPEIVRREVSGDGSAKYGLRLADGALVEAVFMPGEPSRSAVNEFEDARANSDFGFRNSELKKDGQPNSNFEFRISKLSRTSNPKSEIRNTRSVCPPRRVARWTASFA